MIRPTDEQTAKAKATLTARLLGDVIDGKPTRTPERVTRFMEIEIDEPIGIAVIAAPLTLASYAEHLDARTRDLSTAQIALVMDRVGFPEDMSAFLREWPGCVGRIAGDLLDAAGRSAESIALGPFNPKRPPAGMTEEQANDLRAQHPGRLWTLVHPEHPIALVAKAPDPDLYHAARTAFREAMINSKGILFSALHHAKDGIVWSSRPLDAYFEESPAFAEDVNKAFWEMGGSGVATRRRFL